LWVNLPGNTDGGVFAQAALRHGVAVVPGRLLSAAARNTAQNHIRLAFTQSPAILSAAAATLARVTL
jgi:aspartate/methionine/tyrosine aminotransferase